MNDLLRTLLDLDRLTLGADGVRFAFERPLPAYGWGLIVLGAVALALWSYSRMIGPAWVRSGLGLLRASLLLLLAVLIAGPQLVEQSESVEDDWVLVLVDRSASMGIADAPRETGMESGADRVTRQEQLESLLQDSWPMWRSLSEDRVVVWLGFDAGAFDLAPASGGSGAISLGEAQGQRTRLGRALDQALARTAARPLSAIVVLSDGRSTDQPARAVMRRLQADRVPVFSVPLGSEDPIGDIAVRRAEAPGVAFVKDRTPVRVQLERVGSAETRTSGTVRLVDRATGIVLDEQRVDWAPGETEQSVALVTSDQEQGQRTWIVEVTPDGADLIDGNNTSEFTIELVDRPLRVLYIDGYPRWEQRYIKNLLVREESVSSAALILAPDRRYLQEGDIILDALPESPEEWARFDAVVLGDVDPEVFTVDQLTNLREHVARRGGGLVWVGGEGSTPGEWFDTPLSDLLPFRRDAIDGSAIGVPVMMAPTPTAERLGVLQLADTQGQWWPADLLDPSKGWSLLQWAQRIEPTRIKAAVEVLAQAVGSGDISAAPGIADRFPLVLSMRYGAGRVIYVATDETWRWRYARGEKLPERFWLQMLRLLGRESLARAQRMATIEVSPRRADVDQPVRIAVELLDQSLIDEQLPSLSVEVVRRGAEEGDSVSGRVELVLKPSEGGFETYSAVWLPPAAGNWDVVCTDSALAGMNLSGEVVVSLPDDELRHPETNHELLARLSDETGGQVLLASELADLPDRIPNRRVRLLNESTESLWDTPLALILIVGLLTFEWVGRRLIRLL